MHCGRRRTHQSLATERSQSNIAIATKYWHRGWHKRSSPGRGGLLSAIALSRGKLGTRGVARASRGAQQTETTIRTVAVDMEAQIVQMYGSTP